MRTNAILLFLFFSISLTINGQIFQKTYAVNNYSSAGSVDQTTDGGYILLGTTTNFTQNSTSMHLIKVDNQGEEQWFKTYGNTSAGIWVQQTTDGGYILCGRDGANLALRKTDANGIEIWSKTFNNQPVSETYGQCVQQTDDGGYIAVGGGLLNGTGLANLRSIYIVKTDSIGNEEWSKTDTNYTNGEFLSEVVQTNDGGYAIIGSTAYKGFGGEDMHLIKINSTGDIIWTKTYGTASNERGRSLFVTADNGFILLGYENISGGKLFMVKTDSLGNEQWSNYYGGTVSEWDSGSSVRQTTDNGYILAGTKNREMYLVKTNNLGIVEYEITYPKEYASYGYSIKQTTDGGYIFLGTAVEVNNNGYFDKYMFLVKTDSLRVVSIFDKQVPSIDITAYPNPFIDYTTIQIKGPKSNTYSLKLLNTNGQVVKQFFNITSEQVKIERDGLSKGLYIFQITTNKQVVATGKLGIE